MIQVHKNLSVLRVLFGSLDAAKTTPAVLIMPDDLDIFGANFLPPVFEFSFRNVKRGGCNQVVEDNIMLLAPAEGAEVVHVFVIKEVFRDRLGDCIGRAIKQLCCEEEAQGREL